MERHTAVCAQSLYELLEQFIIDAAQQKIRSFPPVYLMNNQQWHIFTYSLCQCIPCKEGGMEWFTQDKNGHRHGKLKEILHALRPYYVIRRDLRITPKNVEGNTKEQGPLYTQVITIAKEIPGFIEW